MKKLFYMAVAAIAALSSCSSDDILSDEIGNGNSAKAPVFTATIESEVATRTVLANGTTGKKVEWLNTDQVFIYGLSMDGVLSVVGDYDVTPDAGDACSATLAPGSSLRYTNSEITCEDATAVYPASFSCINVENVDVASLYANKFQRLKLLQKANQLVLPKTQKYNGTDISQIAPMVGVLRDNNISFQNATALLAITVSSSELTSVQSIAVSSGQQMCGTYQISGSDNTISAVSTTSEDTKSVTLDCKDNNNANTTIPSGGSKTFYVSIPANTYGYLQIDVTDGTSTKTMKTTAASISVERNKIYNIAFEDNQTPAVDPNLLAGVFSVSPTKKVKFTKGNLYCNASVSPATFGFEANQYDFPTSYPSLDGDGLWNCDHVGHFFWKKWDVYSSTDDYAYRDMPYYATCGTGDISTADVFWCGETHPLEVAGTQGLYVLSADEWNYLLNEEDNGGRTGNRYALAKYKDKYGIIIFPDGYTGETSGKGIGQVNGAWNETNPSDNIPDDSWSTMEAAGVVFLPSAGYRNEEAITSGYCRYWSSTPYDVTTEENYLFKAYCLNVINYATNQSSLWSKGKEQRNYGCSIRLVKTVK